jgi:hypothetical protein
MSFSSKTFSRKSSLEVRNAWQSDLSAASAPSTSSVATAAPLEKSTIECAEANNARRDGWDRAALGSDWRQL